MSEERMKILSMVEEGKITADEAARLMAAIEPDRATATPNQRPQVSDAAGAKLHIKVTDAFTDESKVNFAVPLGLARFVSSMVPRGELDQLQRHGVDLDAALDAIDAGATGSIVEVDDEDGHHVRVWIE